MSEATCGASVHACPAYRFAHAGYVLRTVACLGRRCDCALSPCGRGTITTTAIGGSLLRVPPRLLLDLALSRG